MIGIFAGKGISGTKADSAVKNSVQNEDTAIEIKPVNLPQKHGAKDDSIVISAFLILLLWKMFLQVDIYLLFSHF